MNKQILKPLTVAIAAITVGGCGGSSSSDSDGGSFSLGLTDAPTDKFNSVNIPVTGVVLKPSDGSEKVTFNIEGENGGPKPINLLDFQGSKSVDLLADENVPTGDYDWVRLELDADSVTVGIEGVGQEEPVFVPSGAQTGLKTTKGISVSEEGNTDYTIDFDAKKSIIDRGGAQAGNDQNINVAPNETSASYILRPTLRLVDNLDVGSLSGTVDVSLMKTGNTCGDTNGAVYVYKGAEATVGEFGSDAEPLAAAPVTMGDNDLTYEAGFLEAGDYTLAYVCQPDDNDMKGELDQFIKPSGKTGNVTVSVTAGETTTRDFLGASQ